jgi:hypothetical protein
MCGKCTQHKPFFTHRTQQESPWILRNGGVKYRNRFCQQVRKHEESDMHILAIELDEERDCEPLEYSLQQQQLEARDITANLFRTTYDNALHYRAFLDYENLVSPSIEISL